MDPNAEPNYLPWRALVAQLKDADFEAFFADDNYVNRVFFYAVGSMGEWWVAEGASDVDLVIQCRGFEEPYIFTFADADESVQYGIVDEIINPLEVATA